MLTIFLGAGFSKWAADLPVASQLFDFNIKIWGPRESKKLQIVKTLHACSVKRYSISYSIHIK